MTPKEKANELVDKFWLAKLEDGKFINLEEAKYFAKITVNELLHDIDSPNFDYWSKVKAEIIKL